MKTVLRLSLLVLLITALAAAYLWWQAQQRGAEPPSLAQPPAAPGEAPVPAVPVAPSEPRYPVPAPTDIPAEPASPLPSPEQQAAEDAAPPEAAPPAEPLPPLNASTTVITQILGGMFGEDVLAALFNSDEFVRRLVVTVDSLTEKKLPRQHLLFKRVPGPFLVAGEGDARSISPDNAARYAPYAQLAMRIETPRLVNLYARFYPLFQEAYAELGKPDAYFNDRVVEVIDNLLATPDVAEPIPVVQPKVFYLYADPELESLSAGQKALLRMGAANAAQVKAKLRALRLALANEPAPGDVEDDTGDAAEDDAGNAAGQNTVPAAPALKVE
jgi:hypothetical protein